MSLALSDGHVAQSELCCGGAARWPALIYIIGSGRSGSTVLERVMHSAPGVVAVGEVHALWRLPLTDLMCSCGAPVATCGFWRAVLTTAGIGAPALARLADLERAVVRNRYLLRLGYDAGRMRADPRLAEFAALQSRLFAAIRLVSGARLVIDSSKAGPRGWVLAAFDAPVMLHAYRGARAVLGSWRRAKSDPATGVLMPQPPVSRAAADWIKAEQAARRLAWVTPLRRIDHARFATAPRVALSEALNPVAPGLVDQIRWTGPARVQQGDSYHSVLGNPDRHDRADIVIRPPAPARLGTRERVTVGAIGAVLETLYP